MDIQEYIQSGIIESYVLGLATEEETAELEKLCLEYPELKLAVQTFEAEMEGFATTHAVAPDPAVKDAITAALFTQSTAEHAAPQPVSETPVVPLHAHSEALPMRSRRWPAIAAAAIILLVVSAALNVYYYSNYKNVTSQYQALLLQRNTLEASNETYKAKYNDLSGNLRLLGDTATRTIKMTGLPGKPNSLATIYWNRQTNDVYLQANYLPETPTGKQYQLWAIVDGKPVDAGMVGDCAGALCKMKNIPSAQAFAITLEKTGGSPTPTLTAMLVLGKV